MKISNFWISEFNVLNSIKKNTAAMNVVLVVHIIFALTITLLECIYIGIYAPSINNTGYDDLNQFGK